jgi:hypothetical protein
MPHCFGCPCYLAYRTVESTLVVSAGYTILMNSVSGAWQWISRALGNSAFQRTCHNIILLSIAWFPLKSRAFKNFHQDFICISHISMRTTCPDNHMHLYFIPPSWTQHLWPSVLKHWIRITRRAFFSVLILCVSRDAAMAWTPPNIGNLNSLSCCFW